MSSRFSRFLHLERARGEKPGPEGQVRLEGGGGRFESVTGPGDTRPSQVAVPEAHVERFKHHGQAPLAFDADSSEAQRFPRCVRCQTENGRFTQVCTTCGADLQAPEQLAYDTERARETRQAEAQLRERLVVKPHALQNEAERLAEKQRFDAELRQALEADRSWLSKMSPLFTPSLGMGLLRLIPNPAARWSAIAWGIGLPFLLVRFGNRPLQVLGMYLGAALLVIFVPTSLWTAERNRWD